MNFNRGEDVATEISVEALDDPIEAAYLAGRRKARRRVLVVILTTLGLVILSLAWKAGQHLVVASWLEANHYRVSWGIDPSNRNLGGGTSVKGVPHYWSINDNSARNADLKYLTSLHRVEGLDLSLSVGLIDTDLAILDRLTALQSLNLDRSRTPAWINIDYPGYLTDATLSRIKGLRNLEELNLGSQPITDAGLANLRGLGQLQYLELRKTEITDAGLEHLKALPRLKSLDLTGTKVTAREIQKFEAARPDVKVIADPESTAIPTLVSPK
jgi:hypothetical protein